jgi:ribosomal protein L11 methyltransferase
LWPDARGLAVDNDPEAVACCDENLARNHVATVASLTGTIDATDGPFDLILANIQADVLCAVASAIAAKLAADGCAVLSGILLDQVDEVLASYAAVGLTLGSRRDEGEWAGLSLHKGGAGR